MFKNINIDVKNADWLSDSTKNNLLKIYDSVSVNDATDYAIKLLNFDCSDLSPQIYKQVVVSLFRCLILEGANEVMGNFYNDAGNVLKNLHSFFDALDNECFHKLMDIYAVYNQIYLGKQMSTSECEEKSFELVAHYTEIGKKQTTSL
ncbi:MULTISPECIES: hypothetical protein [Olivibacter]|uniref:Uncharacterized protein n=1 Tax=Olivibacter jilunii TaxID=985016 RepID=A0ABW6AXV0_9SPHI